MKIKKLFSVALIAVLLSLTTIISASATTFYYSSGYELYKDSADSGWIINSCSLEDSEISLPGYLLGGNVTTVGGMSFQNRTNLTYVNIPNSFTTIGAYAFSGCTSLKDIYFGENLKYLYVGAFRYCDSIKSLELSDTKLELIANTAFYHCDELERVILPDTLESIGANAFASCPKLETVYIGKNVKTISDKAFNESDNAIIYCYSDSYAHHYAENNRIDHVLLDGDKIGDVNGDGAVDILDATEIQKYAAESTDFTDEQFELGDINKDGYCDVIDALLVQKSVIGAYEIPQNIIRY